MSTSNWYPARKCPICNGSTCLITGDPSSPAAVLCCQRKSEKEIVPGCWLHELDNRGPTWPKWRVSLGKAAEGIKR